MTTSMESAPQRAPESARELLDREQARVLDSLAVSVRRLGETLCAAAELRPAIRRSPLLTSGLAVLLGFVGSPLVPGLLRRGMGVALGAPRVVSRVPGFVFAALRIARARR